MLAIWIIIVVSLFCPIFCLDNGLARTPPMGWIAWDRFKCNVDCNNDPNNCISEKLFMDMADVLFYEGYKAVGYVHVNIDDCWQSLERDSDGNMQADPDRFPNGIKFLADYMHTRGLKLGIYQDFGRKTCMGYPGIIGHMEQDANLFAKWEVDMVKLDGCHSHPKDMDEGYISMGNYINKTKRPMVYSCSWPYYQLINQMDPNYKLVAKHCNLWRNFHDIEDSWESIQLIIDFYGDNQEVLSPHIGPGHWSDPDMLIIGNFHLAPGQARVHMAFWCILPAPLLMSNDLRSMQPEYKRILMNVKAIAINQDPLGRPGKRIYKKGLLEIWRKPILPVQSEKTSYAVLFLNRYTNKKIIKMLYEELGLDSEYGYNVFNVFGDETLGTVTPKETLTLAVEPMDVVMINCKLLSK